MKPTRIFALLMFLMAATPSIPAQTDNEVSVRAAVNHYFEVWTQQDMDAYTAAFHPEAVIFFVHESGAVERMGVAAFVASQREAHAQSTHAMKEIPVTTEIALRGNHATAFVFWKLTAGSDEQTGIDAFTFVRKDGRWLILSLVFVAAE